MNRFVARFAAVLVLMAMAIAISAPTSARARQQRHKPPKHHRLKNTSQTISAHVTFHNAKPSRKTTLGKRQTAKMAAINRSKYHPLMGKGLVPYAYKDKKTGKKVPFKFSGREIADVMGPGPRRKPYYHIDYYLSGPVPDGYDDYNNTTWYFKVVE